MKKIISFILIFSIIFSYRIPATQAAAPALALIGAAAIGATVVAIGGTQYAQKAGGSYSFNGSHLTREMIAYTNSAITKQTIDQMAAAQGLMQQAGGYVLGKAVKAVFDAQKAYNDDVIKKYPELDNAVKNYFNNSPVNNPPSQGDVVSKLDQNYVLGEAQNTYASQNAFDDPKTIFIGPFTFFSGNYLYHTPEIRFPNASPGAAKYYGQRYPLTLTENPKTYPPSNPDYINPNQASDIAEHINNNIANNGAIANELDNLMKDHPELWAFPDAVAVPDTMSPGSEISDYPPAWPITPPQVKQWAAEKSIAAQQALVDDLQAKVDANPNDLALQTALSQEKAKLVQMQATSVGDLAQSEQLEKAKDLEISEPAVPDPELKSINLDPIKETQGIMMNKFPFSILGAAGSMFSVLVATPQAPSFIIDLGIVQTPIDLSTYDIFASNIRAVMSFLIYGLCAYACLRIWSRF